MDDLAGMITELLKDPSTMEQLKGLTGLLGQNDKPQQEPQKHAPTSQFDMSALPTDTMQTIMKLMPIISSVNKDDDNTRFLHALRPLLHKERQQKLDEAARMLQIMKVLPLLKNQGIF